MDAEINPFRDSLEHLLAELERIDLLIRLAVRRARALHKPDDQFQGLYISDEEIDQLLAKPLGMPRAWAFSGIAGLPEVKEQLAALSRICRARCAAALSAGIGLRLAELASSFGLDAFDIDCILICLAPELDLRYERLYAWLQDDLTKKHATVDLILNLLCPSLPARLEARQRFLPKSSLVYWKLLRLFEDPQNSRAPLLAQYLQLDERIASWLLQADAADARFATHIRRRPAAKSVGNEPEADLVSRLDRVSMPISGRHPVFYLHGPRGSRRENIAAAVSAHQGRDLAVVNGAELLKSEDPAVAIRMAVREAILARSALYWRGFNDLLADDKRTLLETLFAELESMPAPAFLSGETAWEPSGSLRHVPFMRFEFQRPDPSRRLDLWRECLGPVQVNSDEVALIAEKFRFTEGQILDAAETARNLARRRCPERPQMTAADLYSASRLQSNQKLSSLARKITPHFEWRDIILPADRIEQLREISACLKYRALVHDEWGFGRKLSLGKGLNLLFSGPSGTGKTMAADIMAHELQLDLYKVDLATVVSKYIGETEKNLSRIFEEAETSNAILFFDEADALFGKRSEVRDAHDRYANIEIGFLLQRMEEHEGVVILATNFRKNMDDAFIRRLHFTVDFPFPAIEDRRRIWQSIWPPQTALSASLDLNYIAAQFELSGGNIRNAALGAAFLAADDGRQITMDHVMRAIRREYQKMGKVEMEGEFATPDEIS